MAELHLISLLKSQVLQLYKNLKAQFRTSSEVFLVLQNLLQRKWADFYKGLKWFLRNQIALAQELFDDLTINESETYGLNFSWNTIRGEQCLGKIFFLGFLNQKSLENCSRCLNDPQKQLDLLWPAISNSKPLISFFLLSLDKVQVNFLPAVDYLCLVQWLFTVVVLLSVFVSFTHLKKKNALKVLTVKYFKIFVITI